MTDTLLEVEDLRVMYRSDGGAFAAVRGVSFALGREKLAIVGESGSGKSTIGRAILKLLPRTASISAQAMRLGDINLMTASERDMRGVRGRHIAMILQDPRYALNPLISVGEQIAESWRVHRRASHAKSRERALALMRAVRIADPVSVYGLYPHQVSGGMGQRIMIAAMLIQEPAVLIADEPTSALDVSVRLQVLAILDDLVSSRGLGLVLITHDLGLAATFCERVMVLYRGEVVETLASAQLAQATHPYTRGLLSCAPTLQRVGAGLGDRRLPVLDRAALE